jgi:sugar/nucleoside kinase (ribokinase family)
MHDVVSLGNPLMDILIDVEEGFLKELNLIKGNMHLLNQDEIEKMEEKLKGYKKKLAPGGSEANTLAALSMLGRKVMYFGKVGKDREGEEYRTQLIGNGVISRIVKVDGLTGRAITFITPDSERTFATHLGVAVSLEDNEINEADIMEAKFLHITSYILSADATRKACFRALEIAKNNNVKICLDLGDPNIINAHKEILSRVAQEYADIIIANESEAKAFTGLNPKEALDKLAKIAEIAIIKLGSKGSIIKSKGAFLEIPGFKAQCIDTTGAGDIYTAGFLYGLLNNLDLKTSGTIASFISSKVCEVKGARLQRIPIEEINRIKNAHKG